MVKGEHIPFVKHTPYSEEEVLPIDEYGPLTYNDMYKLYKIDVESDFVLKVGVKYTVTWDDTIYVCEGQDITALMSGAVAIGNGVNFGYKGNNEPFILVTRNGFLSVCAVNDTNENYHTVRVRIVTEEKDTIKPESIPEPPFFDLVAMGLPDIPLDGTTVSTAYDITAIREAAKRRPIKIRAAASLYGTKLTMESLVNAIFVPETGGFMVSVMSMLDGVPFICSAEFYDNTIQASAVPLAVASLS